MKTNKKKKKNFLKYIFWLGPILSIMGISAWVVGGVWSPVAMGLLIAGVAIIGLWLIVLGSLSPGFWGRRSTQAGTNALIATLAVLVILGLLNFLGARYTQRVDLTETQLFTLSPLSQAVVKNLQQPLKILIFSPSTNPADLELLRNYRRYGSKLQFELVDPQLQPTRTQQFNVKSAGEVYVEYGSQRKLVQTVSDAERLSEIKLTNGIQQVTSDRSDKVYFLQGHGERPLEAREGGLSQAITSLKDKAFTPLPLNLAERTEVPQDASLVVVAGPKQALFEGEVQALKNYLSNGGSLLLMIDPEIKSGLDSLLAEWGVKLDRQVVVDASGQGRVVGLGPATPLVSSYGSHPITKDFGNNYSLYPVARPIEVTPVQGITQTPLLRTNEQSWAESTPEKQPLQFDAKSDRPGPITLGVALSRKAQPSSASPTPTPQTTTTPGASPSPTGSPTASPSPKPQATTTPGTSASPSPSLTGQASPSPTPKAQATASPGTSPTPIAQATPSPSVSPSPGASPKGSPTSSPTPTASASANPSASASPKGSPTSSPTPTASASASPNASASPKGSPTSSPIPTASASASPSASPSPGTSPKGSLTTSPTPTASASASPGASPSPSPSPTGQASPLPQNAAKTDNKNAESRLVAIGNSSFSTNGWFEQQLNGDVFLNSVSWLSKRDNQPLSIRPREQKNRRINLTAMQAGILGWTALFIMPLLGLTTAGVMWWRRR